jgi:hypothetical protein
MKYRLLHSMFLLAALLSACGPQAQPAPASARPDGPQAWLDAPLDGTSLTLPVAYTLVCHGSDPSGVQEIEFSLDELTLAVVPNPDPGATLFHAAQPWEPVEAGMLTVRCRSLGASGEWSGFAQAVVFVAAEPEVVSSTPSHTPTSTAAATLTPTSTVSTIAFTSQVSSAEFEYQHDCVPDPAQVTVTALLPDTNGVKSVYLFFRLESAEQGVTTEWNDGLPMTAIAGGYNSTVSWDAIPQLDQIEWSSAVFVYQFVAFDESGQVLARSQVYRNVTLRPCE